MGILKSRVLSVAFPWDRNGRSPPMGSLISVVVFFLGPYGTRLLKLGPLLKIPLFWIALTPALVARLGRG